MNGLRLNVLHLKLKSELGINLSPEKLHLSREAMKAKLRYLKENGIENPYQIEEGNIELVTEPYNRFRLEELNRKDAEIL